MTRELADARATSAAGTATLEWEAQAASLFGRFRLAHERFQQGIQELQRAELSEQAGQWTAEDAELYAIAGECGDARRQVSAALRLSRDTFTMQRAARTLALCGAATDVASLSTELTKRFPDAILTKAIQIPVASAALALQQDRPSRTIDLLEPVTAYDHAPSAEFWPEYLRGLAHLRLGDGAAAAAQFQGILEHRGVGVTSPLVALAHAGAARAAALRGDTAAARRSYEALFDLWKEADSSLQPLVDARREYGRLR
jgi:hypothetical protein